MEEQDLFSVPNEWCPHIPNDHPPVCTQPPNTSCLKCPEYLDGTTDIPLSEELMTENMRDLLLLRNKRDCWYAELDPIYTKVHIYDDPIERLQKKVRKEQGR